MGKYDGPYIVRPPVYVSGHPPPLHVDKDESPEKWLLWHWVQLREEKRKNALKNGLYDLPDREPKMGRNSMAFARGMVDYAAIRAAKQRA